MVAFFRNRVVLFRKGITAYRIQKRGKNKDLETKIIKGNSVLSNLPVWRLDILINFSVSNIQLISDIKEKKEAPERSAKGRTLSQTKNAILGRLFRREHSQYIMRNSLNRKKQNRLRRIVALLETRTLRTKFKDRRDECIAEYVECSDVGAFMSTWFLED